MSSTNSVSGSAIIPGLRCPVCREKEVEFHWMPATRARQQGGLVCNYCGYESDYTDFDEFDDLKGSEFLKHWKPSRKERGIDTTMTVLAAVQKDLADVCAGYADPSKLPINPHERLTGILTALTTAVAALRK